MMPILNYTTKIKVDKTASEIQSKLAKAGAQAVMIEYDPDGILDAISFRIKCRDIMVGFRLPAQIDRIYVLLQNDNNVPRKLKNKRTVS